MQLKQSDQTVSELWGIGHALMTSGYDVVEGVQKNANYVWDTGSLTWVKMTQPGGGGGAGDASAANQTTQIGLETSIRDRLPAALVGGRLSVDVGVSVLPTGASTEVTLAALNAKLNSLGQKTMANSAPVVLSSDQSAIPVTGPLTDTQLRAVAVPVSGPLTDVQLRASAVPVDVSDKDARILGRVKMHDGTDVALITTGGSQQMVPFEEVAGVGIGAAADAAAAGNGSVIGILKQLRALLAGGLPAALSGGRLDVVVGAALPAGTNNIGDVDVLTLPALPAGTNNIGDVDVLTLPALPAGTNRIGSVRLVDSADADQTSVIGTQTSRFVGAQRSIDAGRNHRVFMLDAITAAPLAEALATVVQWYNNAAVAGTTQPAVVPAGKRLRLTTWKIQYQSLATVGYAVVRVRANTGGLVVIGSPLVASFEAGSGSGATTAAMTGGVTTQTGEFPEGFELPAGTGIGFSVAGYGPTGTLTLEGGVRFMVAGYEY